MNRPVGRVALCASGVIGSQELSRASSPSQFPMPLAPYLLFLALGLSTSQGSIPETFHSDRDFTPVLNQLKCGSCYAFAAAQVVAMRTGDEKAAGRLPSVMQMIMCNSHVSATQGVARLCVITCEK